MNTYSKHRRTERRSYWPHLMIIFALFCVASEMDFREQSVRYGQVQR